MDSLVRKERTRTISVIYSLKELNRFYLLQIFISILYYTYSIVRNLIIR